MSRETHAIAYLTAARPHSLRLPLPLLCRDGKALREQGDLDAISQKTMGMACRLPSCFCARRHTTAHLLAASPQSLRCHPAQPMGKAAASRQLRKRRRQHRASWSGWRGAAVLQGGRLTAAGVRETGGLSDAHWGEHPLDALGQFNVAICHNTAVEHRQRTGDRSAGSGHPLK